MGNQPNLSFMNWENFMRQLSSSFLILVFLFCACGPDPATRDLIEQNQVKEVLTQLFVETDNRNWQDVAQCFAREVLFDMTSLAGGEPTTMTPQNIVDAWDKGLKSLNAIHHQVGNFRIQIGGNSADAFCYGIASHYLPNEKTEDTRTFIGSYNFHLTKTKDIWRIDYFKFNLKYTTGNMNLEGE
jgi:3-phenylpropionate/cinnamic acid dioxygenase small subunit